MFGSFGKFAESRCIDPRDVDSGYQAASVTLAAGKYGEAAAMFEEMHTEYPEREEFALGLTLAKKYSGDEESYRYLAESIRKHPPQEELAHMMRTAGFDDVRYRDLTGGIVAIHSGVRA